jgi:prevent-host-death family protein
MAYTVHQAKTNFSRILKEVEAGQEVIVMRGKKPVATVVPIDAPAFSRSTLAGSYRGKLSWTEGAFDPLTDAELREMGMGYLADSPLAPSNKDDQ